MKLKNLMVLDSYLVKTIHTPELKEKLIEGALEETGGRSIEELEAERDRVLLGLLSLRGQEES